MVIRKQHCDIGFKVWRRQRTWFWFVASPYADGGTIGAAATEAEAIRAAGASVETVFNGALAPAKARI